MKRKRILLALVAVLLLSLAGLVQANSPLAPGSEPKSILLAPKETRGSLENTSTQSAMPQAGPLRIGGWGSRVADHAGGLGLGLLVGGAVAVGLVAVAALVVAGPVLGVIAIGAIVAGGLYGLLTGAARFNVADAAVQSLIGGVSAGVGFVLGAGLLAGRALVLARAAANVTAGGLASMASYLIQTPHPTAHGAGAAFAMGAGTAGVFLGLGALGGKLQGAIRATLGGGRAAGATAALSREAAATVEHELVRGGPAMTQSSPAALQRLERAAAPARVLPSAAVSEAGEDAASMAPRMGSYREIRAAKLQDGHHIIQEAAVRDLPGYNRKDAPVVHLPGPSTDRATPHGLATQAQRANGGGTYAEERAIAENGLRAAGLSEADIQKALAMADRYFYGLGVTDQTPLRLPGDRAK